MVEGRRRRPTDAQQLQVAGSELVASVTGDRTVRREGHGLHTAQRGVRSSGTAVVNVFVDIVQGRDLYVAIHVPDCTHVYPMAPRSPDDRRSFLRSVVQRVVDVDDTARETSRVDEL
jgi:hypothetical protein